MKKVRIVTFLLLFCSITMYGQKNDTVIINGQKINANVLVEGTHRYLVYFKMSKDSVRTGTQFWTRTIKRIDYNGTPAIEVDQVWEDKDSIVHIVKSISDAKSMKPLYHKTWWKVNSSGNAIAKTVNETTVDFANQTVNYNGKLLSNADTANRTKRIWNAYQSSLNKHFFNWHIDLEIFPVLPYKAGRTFIIPFYDPGTASPCQEVVYTVTSSGVLRGFNDQKIACWMLVHEEKGNKEIFWVSKKTREVLKLEQEINGRIYRYKIKLGFSM